MLISLFQSGKSFVLDLLFPAYCAGCKREGQFLCASCARNIVIRRVALRSKLRGVSEIYAACDYRQPLVASLIKQLKYEGVKEMHSFCADAMVSHFSFVGFTPHPQALVVPVPLSTRRLRERGFNQSELIARKIAQALHLTCDNTLLLRTRHTVPQTEMSLRRERLFNVRNAFSCITPERVNGRHVILIDDVFTTGATLSECAKVLQSAGAKKVTALVVAA